uniref:NADH dehydrogenase subunit 5 n=1 Tax=Cantonius szechuanensis TaxID=3045900 RepID=UPI00257C689D|nr:NADH dehydrogenase subunit 5 [Cantonius szechuanensis]WHE42528.1 NADH dehydrogenase subunit 5 [Cantonius szechuanensis]
MVCIVYFLMFLLFSIIFFSLGMYFLFLDLTYFIEIDFISLNSCSIVMTLLLDWMSFIFMSFVLFISSMVIYYSQEYMSGDLNLNRFIYLVCLFVLSMMLLIISPNLISILLGWDGLGLVSYCLVIYYQNVKSSSAGMLTALSNRVGDVAILLSIAWMMNYGSWNFIYYLDFMKNDFSMWIIGGLVCLAAMTKSAQLPFSSWLPAAMAAPTPVSSLVHSSTLVTAGVYLMVRFFNCLSSNILLLLLIISMLTMFMAGLGANFEYDLKKIIALSTLSQLGLMMSIIALGEPLLAFFHLLMHALFKALLFMCAGYMIHMMTNNQDIRFMGGLSVYMPLICSMFNVCNFALCGLPFLSGFYSKDLILEVMSLGVMNIFIYLIYFVSTGLTVSYSVRLAYYSLVGSFSFLNYYSFSDEGKLMFSGMLGLIFLVIFGGSMLSWLLFSFPYMICLPTLMKMMTLLVVFIGGILGYHFSKLNLSSFNLSLNNYLSCFFIASMWNMPFMSTLLVNYPSLKLGAYYLKYLDQGWFEYFGSQNLYNFMGLIFKNMLMLFSVNFKSFLMLWSIWMLIILMFI